jgi:branched-subunit amino acid ABC-type transport system permease component
MVAFALGGITTIAGGLLFLFAHTWSPQNATEFDMEGFWRCAIGIVLELIGAALILSGISVWRKVGE